MLTLKVHGNWKTMLTVLHDYWNDFQSNNSYSTSEQDLPGYLVATLQKHIIYCKCPNMKQKNTLHNLG